MWLWRRGRQGEAQSEGGWSFPMWVGLDRAGVVVLCIPILRPHLSPWSLLHTMVRNRHRRTHSVYCPMPSLNVYIDKHHRGNQVSLAGTTQRMGQEAPPPHHSILLMPGLGWSSHKVL